jgi:hypothetical protein
VAVSFFGAGLNGILHRWRMRGASLPWHELEAEAARQGCSPADIFFDRAGRGDPTDVEPAAVPAACVADVDDGESHELGSPRAPWRGYDPLPAPRTS